MTPVRMEIVSDPVRLPEVRAVLEGVCRQVGFDDRTTGKIILSVDEALTNVIRHAYNNVHDKPIEIEIIPRAAKSPGLRVIIRDYGTHVDPSRIKSRDLADIRPGGLGVHIIRQCMDSVEYRAAQGGGSVLTLEKNLSPEQEGERT